MSTKLCVRQEKIEKVIAKLVEKSNSGTSIVVEGKKDVNDLKLLGVEG